MIQTEETSTTAPTLAPTTPASLFLAGAALVAATSEAALVDESVALSDTVTPFVGTSMPVSELDPLDRVGNVALATSLEAPDKELEPSHMLTAIFRACRKVIEPPSVQSGTLPEFTTSLRLSTRLGRRTARRLELARFGSARLGLAQLGFVRGPVALAQGDGCSSCVALVVD